MSVGGNQNYSRFPNSKTEGHLTQQFMNQFNLNSPEHTEAIPWSSEKKDPILESARRKEAEVIAVLHGPLSNEEKNQLKNFRKQSTEARKQQIAEQQIASQAAREKIRLDHELKSLRTQISTATKFDQDTWDLEDEKEAARERLEENEAVLLNREIKRRNQPASVFDNKTLSNINNLYCREVIIGRLLKHQPIINELRLGDDLLPPENQGQFDPLMWWEESVVVADHIASLRAAAAKKNAEN